LWWRAAEAAEVLAVMAAVAEELADFVLALDLVLLAELLTQ
jgi:hypothetical protein